MRSSVVLITIAAALLTAPVGPRGARASEKTDEFTQELIQRCYDLNGISKPDWCDTRDGRALSWVVARYARRTSGWETILERARKRCRLSIRMLGMMLAEEARERRYVSEWDVRAGDGTGDVPPGARQPTQRSDIRDRVVPAIRGLLEEPKLHRWELRALVLALVRSRHPDLADVYLELLKREKLPLEAGFYAAVGLARLGNEAGELWLKKHTNHRGKGSVSHPPIGAASESIRDCCTEMLKNVDQPFPEKLTWIP